MFDELFREVETLSANHLQSIVTLLNVNVSHYDWVGFYLVDAKDPSMLVLGPYSGDPTDHVHIPFGKGVCGAVAEKKQTKIVGDVAQEKNYLCCSLNVKSEMVVPIIKNQKVIGVLDIDSHTPHAFSQDDVVFLEKVCARVAKYCPT